MWHPIWSCNLSLDNQLFINVTWPWSFNSLTIFINHPIFGKNLATSWEDRNPTFDHGTFMGEWAKYPRNISKYWICWWSWDQDTSIFRLGGWKAKQSRDDDRGILILTANYIVVDKEMPGKKKTKTCIEHQRWIDRPTECLDTAQQADKLRTIN